MIVLLIWWIVILRNRTQRGRIRYWIWSIVLGLQVATILAAPGNCYEFKHCYEFKQGARCYSNWQIVFGGVPATGPSTAPHWTLVEDAFGGLVVAYGMAVIAAMVSTVATGRRGDRP